MTMQMQAKIKMTRRNIALFQTLFDVDTKEMTVAAFAGLLDHMYDNPSELAEAMKP